jgi:hypothetical protein
MSEFCHNPAGTSKQHVAYHYSLLVSQVVSRKRVVCFIFLPSENFIFVIGVARATTKQSVCWRVPFLVHLAVFFFLLCLHLSISASVAVYIPLYTFIYYVYTFCSIDIISTRLVSLILLLHQLGSQVNLTFCRLRNESICAASTGASTAQAMILYQQIRHLDLLHFTYLRFISS